MHRSGAELVQADAGGEGTAMVGSMRKSVRTSVMLSEDAYARVQAVAVANDVSAAWVIRHAVLKFLDKRGDQAALQPLRSSAKKATVR
jgi:hypothetical protein